MNVCIFSHTHNQAQSDDKGGVACLPKTRTRRTGIQTKIYIFKIFTISLNQETYTEECAHAYSQH